MTIRFVTALILSLIGFGAAARADHLPEHLQNSGNPERRIGGINLESFKLTDVVKLYGQPTRVKAWESDDPKFANSYDYYWIKRDVTLKVVIQRVSNFEYISLVEVEGAPTQKRIGRTGAGLRLGNTLADLVRIYGRRLKIRKIPELKIHDVMIQWHREEYSLVATLDRHNRITALALFAPE